MLLYLISVMGSLDNPKTWVPYMNTKDCSQGFCSLYCPQWCYVIFSPPPPHFDFPDENSGPNFSPLVIAIVGILASAFLLVSYYAIISKFCGNMGMSPRRRRRENLHDPNMEHEENQDPSNHEPWHVGNDGLDESLIKSITVCKYKKNDGLIEGTDCSVCLSEFQESENLRLLPKCSHAFHVKCIDTWLRSHSNCPLCRANIGHVNVNVKPLPLPTPVEIDSNPTSEAMFFLGGGDTDTETEDDEVLQGGDVGKTPIRALSDIGNTAEGDTVIEIRSEEESQQIRRSVSMSNLCQADVSIAEVICIDQDEDGCEFEDDGGSSEKPEMSRFSHSVTSPVAMKRSFSSGRFLFPKLGRAQNILIPL